jgi:acyl carrier protein
MWSLGAALGYRVELKPCRDAGDGSFDAVFFRRDDHAAAVRVTAASVPARVGGAWREFANNPLVAIGRRDLTRELRAYLQQRLPAHMVPAFFVVMESLPKTTAGKVDVASLPAPEPAGRQRAAPRRRPDPSLAALAALWERLLGVEAVHRDESFFELGGNSLLVIQLVHLIEQELGVRISPVAVFEQPTLRGLARLIAEKTTPGPEAKLIAPARHGEGRTE